MRTLRFLHLADVHLDTPFYGKDEYWRTRLRKAVRAAFARGIDLAIARQAQAVLVAGDLFDNELLTFATEQFLLGQVGRLQDAGIPFFYATGNHDPGRANYRAHNLVWPANVHIFRKGHAEEVPIKDASGETVGWITGAGHVTNREERNLAAGFGRAQGGLPHVALLHTQVVSARGAENHNRYAPATLDDLAAGGFDYWALGHIHLRQQVAPELPAWYAGNIQGRNPRETGFRGALWVEVQKGAPVEPEFVPLGELVWQTVEAVCPPEAATLDELVRGLVGQVEAVLSRGPDVPGDLDPEYLVRVVLTGRSLLAGQLRDPVELAILAAEVEHATGVPWVEIRLGSITRPLDLAALRQGPSVLATALDLMETAKGDEDLLRTLVPEQLARDLPPEVRAVYLRELLDGLDGELAERLVPGDER